MLRAEVFCLGADVAAAPGGIMNMPLTLVMAEVDVSRLRKGGVTL